MANELKGVVTFTDDSGAAWKVSYPVNTLIAIEEATGKGINALLEEISQQPSLKLMRTFVAHGLKTHHPEMTEMQAGDLMTDSQGKALESTMEALAIAFPAHKSADDKPTEAEHPNA